MKMFYIVILAIMLSVKLDAQDVINPYADYSIANPVLNPQGNMPQYSIPNIPYTYNYVSTFPFPGNNGNGEYIINFRLLPWCIDY